MTFKPVRVPLGFGYSVRFLFDTDLRLTAWESSVTASSTPPSSALAWRLFAGTSMDDAQV